MEDAVRLMGRVIASGANGHIFCLDLMFYYWNTNLHAAKQEVEDVEGDLKGKKQKALKAFKMEDHVLLYIKRTGV